MGMYTELHLNVELKRDVPESVLAVLRHMVADDEGEPPALPDHPLFATERWRYMLQFDSYYFPADTHSTLRLDDISHTWYLCVRCNLKNYGGATASRPSRAPPARRRTASGHRGAPRCRSSDPGPPARRDSCRSCGRG